MNIEFDINKIPNNKEKKHFIAYLEGYLKIVINKKVFFEESGILLLELGINLLVWLNKYNNDNINDFIYETMDCDETPILAFFNEENRFIVKSVWQKDVMNFYVDKELLIKELNDFIDKLDKELINKTNISLFDFKNHLK